MRIVTDFKDYYDCMARYDEERETIFVRNKTAQVEIKRPAGLPFMDNAGACLFFGGKFYPFHIATRTEKRSIWSYLSQSYKKVTFIYDKDESLARLKNSRWRYDEVVSFFDYFREPFRPELTALIEEYGAVFGIFLTSLFGHNCRHGEVVIEKNIRLEPFGFVKVLPPALAWNQLTNFVNNIARPAKPIPEMDNDTKIQQAGFDLKTSFRKDPRFASDQNPTKKGKK